MRWTKLKFGKHCGKTLPQVVFIDPDWFFWAYEVNALGWVQGEARAVYKRATHIRIPQHGAEKLVAEYAFCPTTGGFVGVEVLPETRLLHQGSSPTVRLPVFDLQVPCRFNHYDKGGSKRLVDALKFHIFGDTNYRLTKKRCEFFFENDANFVVPVERPHPASALRVCTPPQPEIPPHLDTAPDSEGIDESREELYERATVGWEDYEPGSIIAAVYHHHFSSRKATAPAAPPDLPRPIEPRRPE